MKTKCIIAHWRGAVGPPVPEAKKVEDDSDRGHHWEVEVEDLFEFAKEHGMIQLRPHRDGWLIFVTDSGFTQR